MNGIKLLLLLMASAQVEPGTESDYGWAVNKDDGVLEYIVQINPDKKRAMEQRSVQFPNGQENVSNMPRELVGRASRVVIRFGTEILPREPSLQELERSPRLFEPSMSAAAMLGEGQLKDLESPVRNIQGQGAAPVFPTLPSGLAGAQDGIVGAGQTGNLLDQADAMPDPSLLAQNMANQNGAASAFLNEARGGAAGSKFNSTAQPANPTIAPPANPQTNSQVKLPEFPPVGNSSSTFANAAQQPPSTLSSRNQGSGNLLGANNSTSQLYPSDRLNPPSLSNQSTLPQQRTPSSTFGSSPSFTNQPANANQPSSDWATTTNPGAQSYSSNPSQTGDFNYGQQSYPPNYTSAPNVGNPNLGANPNLLNSQNATRTAMNNSPYVQQNATPPSTQVPTQVATPPARQSAGTSGSLPPNAMEALVALDKNKDGQLTADEYAPANVDGILLTLFVVSLLVNLYLGHLIRKLLMRYRVVLTNVRSQAAYT